MTNRLKSTMRYGPGFLRNQDIRRSATAAAICIALTTGSAWADDRKSGGEAKGEEFDEFTVFIEICGTDEDAGIKGLLGGEPWRRATVSGPDGRLLYRFGPKLGDVGSGTVFWESAEPPFVDLPLDRFLDRFREGEYTASGTKVEGGTLRSTAVLTHNLPAGPVITSHEDKVVVELTGENVVVTWEEVTEDFRGGPLRSEIVGYIMTVTFETEILGETVERELTIDVIPPSTFSAEIPADFLEPATKVQIEVAAREESGNRTSKEIFIDVVDEVPDL
jgi:hypothetical protein